MKTRFTPAWLGASLLCVLLCGPVWAADKAVAKAASSGLPPRDLTIELRQIEEGREPGTSYSAGSADNSSWEPQMVQVRNGEKAVLNMHDAIPMQWTQSVSTQNLPVNIGANGGTNGSTSGNMGSGNSGSSNNNANTNQTSVNNALAWFDAGQSIAVQTRWPGGNKPAVLTIEAQRAAVDPRMGAELPKQTRNTVSTTVTVPLAEWVTIATTGRAAKSGVYSSEAGVLGRRFLQVRVMAP